MFYDGTRLLGSLDVNGKKPEIFMGTGNRNSGKTTWMNRYAVKRYINNGEKFMILVRFANELPGIDEAFFKEIGHLFFKDYKMESKTMANGAYKNLFLNGEHCGFCCAINMADKYKRYSHLFSETSRMLFDEFQTESERYCPNEIIKIQSLHKTVARGGGRMVRYVPLIMMSNTVTILNPYFTALGISNRIRKDTKILKGDGWVLEQNYNEDAAKASSESLFENAFQASSYQAYASQNTYLLDNESFIEKPVGRTKYVATVVYKGREYGIMKYPDLGLIYTTSWSDSSYPVRIAATVNDHSPNYVLLKSIPMLLEDLRYYFNMGCFRFSDAMSRECILTLLSY